MVSRTLFNLAIFLSFIFSSTNISHAAVEQRFFSIATGGTAGTYYPIGGIIANAISNPPGSRPCDKGGSCGVPGLIAIASSSNGSVANVNAIQSGVIDSGFVQSDVASWAYTGTGTFKGQPKKDKLRLIANLYPETVHIVTSKGAGIKSVSDLKGKRVSLDEPGSGTLEDAKLVLHAYGLQEADLEVDYLKPGPSGSKIKDNQLDAFFFVAGHPTSSVVELASSVGVDLVPISGKPVEKLLKDYPYFSKNVIPAKTYEGVDYDTPTISVSAQWIVSSDLDDELVYEITKALWNSTTRKLLDKGHIKGQLITLDTALSGSGIPLHPGAERFYREKGLLKAD